VLAASFEHALISHDRTQVRHQDEAEFWDYKEGLDLENPNDIARLAKWMLGFHNAKGGVIIVGVSNDYKVKGMHDSKIIDTAKIKNKIRAYTGPNIPVFQDRIRTSIPGKSIWLIFVQKREGTPLPALKDGGTDRDGSLIIRKDSYYIRSGDEVKRCVSPNDYELLFRGVSFKHLNAYSYEVDEQYFRLLSPHHDNFIGRGKLIEELGNAINSRSYIIALDGVGGVGKSALAIELVRKLYREQSLAFIFSLSAKNRVWHRYSEARQAGFSGFTELLLEMAEVFQIDRIDVPIDKLKKDIVEFMSGMSGLILIDNIEEIRDDAVLNFLRNHIPDPVKVLVTSRVSRDLGARTIPVPEMTEDEARDLLHYELDRIGYHGYIHEAAEVQEILYATGRLPLAIKWVGSLAANTSSLQTVVAQIKRNDDTTKREFLDFCFTTMYDELSDTARDVALLCPYLDNDWNTLTLSLALNKTTTRIEQAINELEDRGIIFKKRGTNGRGVFALPLTLEFLSNKWHQNKALRDAVSKRISEIIGSGDAAGNLFTLEMSERVRHLSEKAFALEQKSSFEQALRLTRLALEYSVEGDELPDKIEVVKLRLLEGRLTYLFENKRDGITRMQMALDRTKLSKVKFSEELLFLAKALFDHGRTNEEMMALDYVLDGLAETTVIPPGLLEECCELGMRHRNDASLAKLIAKANTPSKALIVAQQLVDYWNDKQFIYIVGQPLVSMLRLAIAHPNIKIVEKQAFTKKVEEVQSMPGWNSHSKSK